MSAPLRVLVWTGRRRTLLAVAATLAALSAAMSLVPALILAFLAAVLFEHASDGFTIMQVIFSAITSVVLRLAASIYARVAAAKAAKLFILEMRERAARTIGSLALGDLAALRPGALETLLLDDVERVADAIASTFVDAAIAFAVLGLAACALLLRDWRIGVVVVALWLLTAFALRLLDRHAAAVSDAERVAREDLASTVFRAMRSFSLARSLPVSPDAARPLADTAHAYRLATERRFARGARRAAFDRAAGALLPAAAVLVLAALDGARTAPAEIVLVAAVVLRASGSLARALGVPETLEPAAASARRIAALLARPLMPDGANEPPADATLRFEGVSFAYDAGREPVLRNASFVARAGTVTALVGPSGCGKTTITRLAARFWDVSDGRVTLGGSDVRDLSLDALMRRVACVFQDVALLDDTVAVNLKLGRPDADDATVIAAARAAGAHAFISALPNGYDTVVGERGRALSRGERQRLQIARAIIKDAPIVILDEPTASLDPLTETEIEAALVPLLHGKTVLVVAHRLPTIADADAIVVLDGNGGIEAQGTHAQVLRESPTYAALWHAYGASPNGAVAAPAHASAG